MIKKTGMRIFSEKYPRGIRVAGLILSKDKKRIILIERYKQGRHYFVFPGGGVEETDVTKRGALLREIKEETNSLTKIVSQPYRLEVKGHSKQIFYICEHIKGKPLVIGEEKKKQNHNDKYTAKWFLIKNLDKMTVYPVEIKDWLLNDLASGYWQKRVLRVSSFDLLKKLN